MSNIPGGALMELEVGVSVIAPGFAGVIVDKISPCSYRVARLHKKLGVAEVRQFNADELSPGPALKRFDVGDTVRVFAGTGRVIERVGDLLTVEIPRQRRSFKFVHRYRLPDWQLHCGGYAT